VFATKQTFHALSMATEPADSERLNDNLRYVGNGARYDISLYDSLIRSHILTFDSY